MEIYNDGVPVYELPEYAVCTADEKKRNPLCMDVCPMGYEECFDWCENYREEWQESEDDIMIDAVKYLKERKRMCNSYNNMCDGCGFGKVPKCNHTEDDNPEKAVEIVEKWSKEHPIKTRQSVFLKMFPNGELTELGSLDIWPLKVDKNMNCPTGTGSACLSCKADYWLEDEEME